MRIDSITTPPNRPGPDIVITLSRRNLLTLLWKLDNSETAGIECVSQGKYLRVSCEEDVDHYKDKPIGQMRPEIEEYVRVHSMVSRLHGFKEKEG